MARAKPAKPRQAKRTKPDSEQTRLSPPKSTEKRSRAARKSATIAVRDQAAVEIARARAEAAEAIAAAKFAHARLRDAFEILPQGIVFLDAEGRYILWNQKYSDIYKGSADLFKVGARLADTLRIGVSRGEYPEAAGREEEWIAERLENLRNPRHQHEQPLADGRVILIDERRTHDGGIIGLRIDITEMKQREASIRLLFEGNPVPMFVVARDSGDILAANEAAADHYGYAVEQLHALKLADLYAPGAFIDMASVESTTAEEQAGQTIRHMKSNGEAIDVALFSRRLTHDGRAAVLIAAIDITERKRAEARIAHMAHHDALTDLPNRTLLSQHMNEMLRRQQRSGEGFAVLCIDLDNFKNINDALGHPCGDQLLKICAERLRAVLRDEDVAARLGGDEFAILIANCRQPEQASDVAQRIIDAVSARFTIDGHEMLVGASVGIAMAPDDGDTAEKLLKSADLALYQAKADGRRTFRFFMAEMNARIQARHRLEMDLRRAIVAGELQVHYQPLVDLASGEIAGFEALVRWPHPARGFIPPMEFIPVAEETGLIGPLGAYVMKRACQDAIAWPAHVRLAVNLSPVQFRVGNILACVREALGSSGLDPRRLDLEITEAVLLETSNHIISTLHALRDLGVRISMDDFGTGYSSLSYLRSFPFDKIKIDRSFVRDIGSNPESRAIVSAILGLGSSLGISITAEGIETMDDLACLKAGGCQQGQGYLFSKPRPQAEILDMLYKQRSSSAA